MPIIHRFEQKKFVGGRISPTNRNENHLPFSPFKPLNNHQIYLSSKKEGGIIDFGKLASFVTDNKDLIKVGVSTIGNVASAVKGTSDAIKSSNELKRIQELQNKSKKQEKDIQITDAMRKSVKDILETKRGSGFQQF